MPDPETVTDLLNTVEGQDFQIDIAGLSTAEEADVTHVLQDAADGGNLADLNLDHAILEAQAAEGARGEAETFQAAQAKAADAGDWASARDYADKAEYAMHEVRDHGGNVDDMEIIQAGHDEMNLDNAHWEQQIADDNAVTAQAYAEAGDADHAAQYADTAADHAQTAADYGAAGDQGGAYGDHTVDTSSSYDASASVSSIADTSSSASADSSSATE